VDDGRRSGTGKNSQIAGVDATRLMIVPLDREAVATEQHAERLKRKIAAVRHMDMLETQPAPVPQIGYLDDQPPVGRQPLRHELQDGAGILEVLEDVKERDDPRPEWQRAPGDQILSVDMAGETQLLLGIASLQRAGLDPVIGEAAGLAAGIQEKAETRADVQNRVERPDDMAQQMGAVAGCQTLRADLRRRSAIRPHQTLVDPGIEIRRRLPAEPARQIGHPASATDRKPHIEQIAVAAENRDGLVRMADRARQRLQPAVQPPEIHQQGRRGLGHHGRNLGRWRKRAGDPQLLHMMRPVRQAWP